MLLFLLKAFKEGDVNQETDLYITNRICNLEVQMIDCNCDFVPDKFIITIWKNGFMIGNKYIFNYYPKRTNYDLRTIENIFIDDFIKEYYQNEKIFYDNIELLKDNLLKCLFKENLSYDFNGLKDYIDNSIFEN